MYKYAPWAASKLEIDNSLFTCGNRTVDRYKFEKDNSSDFVEINDGEF